MFTTAEELKNPSIISTKPNPSPVCSYTEWDPLEEVIVGVVDGATFPPWHIALDAVLPDDQRETFRKNAGKSFPSERIAAANKELEEF